MRKVVGSTAGAAALIVGMISIEWMDVGQGWGEVVQIGAGAGAAWCAAAAWWLWRQIRAERRYDAALDAELAKLEKRAQSVTSRTRSVTPIRPARWVAEDAGADPRLTLPSVAGGRLRILATIGAVAVVVLVLTWMDPTNGAPSAPSDDGVTSPKVHSKSAPDPDNQPPSSNSEVYLSPQDERRVVVIRDPAADEKGPGADTPDEVLLSEIDDMPVWSEIELGDCRVTVLEQLVETHGCELEMTPELFHGT